MLIQNSNTLTICRNFEKLKYQLYKKTIFETAPLQYLLSSGGSVSCFEEYLKDTTTLMITSAKPKKPKLKT